MFFNYHKSNKPYGRMCWKYNACLIFLYNSRLKYFSLQKEGIISDLHANYIQDARRERIGINANCSLFISDFNKNWNVSVNFSRTRNVKFHGNPFCGSRVLPKLKDIAKLADKLLKISTVKAPRIRMKS
jgi:hypothetical protein